MYVPNSTLRAGAPLLGPGPRPLLLYSQADRPTAPNLQLAKPALALPPVPTWILLLDPSTVYSRLRPDNNSTLEPITRRSTLPPPVPSDCPSCPSFFSPLHCPAFSTRGTIVSIACFCVLCLALQASSRARHSRAPQLAAESPRRPSTSISHPYYCPSPDEHSSCLPAHAYAHTHTDTTHATGQNRTEQTRSLRTPPEERLQAAPSSSREIGRSGVRENGLSPGGLLSLHCSWPQQPIPNPQRRPPSAEHRAQGCMHRDWSTHP
ncbi:hypothetical protein F4777DRAFT_322694 [Nemania sp. FL0916]|nr:hypothetical protein F4777DRAFT_322694 [Nemania sp. FL0916]